MVFCSSLHIKTLWFFATIIVYGGIFSLPTWYCTLAIWKKVRGRSSSRNNTFLLHMNSWRVHHEAYIAPFSRTKWNAPWLEDRATQDGWLSNKGSFKITRWQYCTYVVPTRSESSLLPTDTCIPQRMHGRQPMSSMDHFSCNSILIRSSTSTWNA